MYLQHRSEPLVRAFSARPFQGAEPESAKFLFVGLDANYDETVEQSPIFPALLEYLGNGVEFWRKYGVHHPFLLPLYKGDGRLYHRTFSAIGFKPAHAADVSFIELLHVPTYGRSALVPDDLDAGHLRRVNNAILHGAARFIFIPGSVGRLMRASGEFAWLPSKPIAEKMHLRIWHETESKTIYWHYHFSVYGKYHKEKLHQLDSIRRLIESGC